MQRGLCGISLTPCDVLTSIEAAEAAGYDAIELRSEAVLGFLTEGHRAEDIAAAFVGKHVRPTVIGVIDDVDLPPGPARERLIREWRQVAAAAQIIGCPAIQALTRSHYAASEWREARRQTAAGLAECADILAEYGLFLSYEPLAWSTVRTASQALEVAEEAGRSNVGILVDTFHMFAGGEDVARLRRMDPALIHTLHIGDTGPRHTDIWSDADRYAMPGEGIVPLRAIIEAVLSTGYAGVASDEIIAPEYYADWSRQRLARTLKERADAVLAEARSAGR
jgi:sugar phosphate isomerase/epimerase